jgi:AAA+ superfamily predicted ATPase
MESKVRTRYIVIIPRGAGSIQYVAMNAIVGTFYSSGANNKIYDSLELIFPGAYKPFPEKRELIAKVAVEALSYARNVRIKYTNCEADDDDRHRMVILAIASHTKNKDVSHLVVLEKYLSEKDIMDLPTTDSSRHRTSPVGMGNVQGGPSQQQQQSTGYIYMPKNDIPLILNKHEAMVLDDVLNAIVNRKRIFEDYGLNQVMDTNSMCFLFHGAPGTGKTQAAKYIAKKLNMPLLVVDHSQIVDKYVGETEKRIAEVFKRAEQEKCILFFDEADSLLGARSGAEHSWEISKVNSLLQSMETFNGVAIFATNYASQLDQAVNRRLLMKVNFELPDQEERAKIWEALLPAKIPKDPLDFKALGKYFMTGGEIKNAIISATVEVAKTNAKLNMDTLNKMAAKVIGERLFDPYKEADKERSKRSLGFTNVPMELK